MTVYLIGHIDITDRETYVSYEAGFLEVFNEFNGEFIAVDDNPVVLEGEKNYTRSVILRFPDRDSALAWYQSDAYQQLASIRWRASTGSISVIEALA